MENENLGHKEKQFNAKEKISLFNEL